MTVLWCLILSLMLYIAVADLLTHKIRNVSNMVFLVISLIIAMFGAGPVGVLDFGLGAVLGLLLLLPFYALRITAAGDVKYFCAIGSLIGAKSLVLIALPATLISGALYASIYLLFKGELLDCLKRMCASFTLSFLSKTRVAVPAEANSASTHVFPYAIAISTGAITALAMQTPPELEQSVQLLTQLL